MKKLGSVCNSGSSWATPAETRVIHYHAHVHIHSHPQSHGYALAKCRPVAGRRKEKAIIQQMKMVAWRITLCLCFCFLFLLTLLRLILCLFWWLSSCVSINIESHLDGYFFQLRKAHMPRVWPFQRNHVLWYLHHSWSRESKSYGLWPIHRSVSACMSVRACMCVQLVIMPI